VFSLYIDLENETSKISFGGFDLDAFAVKNAKVHFHSVSPQSASHWQLDLPRTTLWVKTPGNKTKY
jgi:hypothetical protein